MFLVDTNAISELRKGQRAHPGAFRLLKAVEREIFLPVQVIGELRQGVENLIHRSDFQQAQHIDTWLQSVLKVFALRILPFDTPCAHIWGKLMGPSDQNPMDKQIAAIALHYDMTVITRNTTHFAGTGVRLFNPFQSEDVPNII